MLHPHRKDPSMAALHKYVCTSQKIRITPGSYIALWVPVVTNVISEVDRGILGGMTTCPGQKKVAPALLYTPDGVALQDRTTGNEYGTLTQYKTDDAYWWHYNSNTSSPKYLAGNVLRLWVIDPMPEADALAMARAAYDADTAESMFRDYQHNYHVSWFAGLGVYPSMIGRNVLAGESVQEIFTQAHTRCTHDADREKLYKAYRATLEPAIADIKERLRVEYSRGASTHQAANRAASMISRFVVATPENDAAETIRAAYQEALKATDEHWEALATDTIAYLMPVTTIR